MAQLEMFDVYNDNEWYELYKQNRLFFNKASWFWLKNRHYSSFIGVARCISKNEFSQCAGVYSNDGDAVLYCNTANIKELRLLCEKVKDGILKFKLKNKETIGYVGILKNKYGQEYAGLIIKNEMQYLRYPFGEQEEKYGWAWTEKRLLKFPSLDLPFSRRKTENLYYYDSSAHSEKGTLPWLVENDKFVEQLPNKLVKLLGLNVSQNKTNTNERNK